MNESNESIERNLGEQPLAALLTAHNFRPQDLVATDPTRITHKMIGRATKGRRLTTHSQKIVLKALNTAASASYALPDLFNYIDQPSPAQPIGLDPQN